MNIRNNVTSQMPTNTFQNDNHLDNINKNNYSAH